ncbi:Polyadenylate-binding protein-interacting protein [Sarracenia purpurea var. burkii]
MVSFFCMGLPDSMAAGAEVSGGEAVAAPVVQSSITIDTDTGNVNVESVSIGAKVSDSKSDLKMQDIVDMLSKLKLNPLAKEFFPSSYLQVPNNRDQSPDENLSPVNKHSGDDGYPNYRRV